MKLVNSKAVAWGVLTASVLGFTAVSDVDFKAESGTVLAATQECTAEQKEALKGLPFVMTAGIASDLTKDVILELAEANETVTVEQVQADMVMAVEEQSPWANKVMAKVEEYANIRRTPDAEGELAGKLYKGAAGDILERGEEWTKISSGTTEGYVKNDYLAFDAEAETIANAEGKTMATVQTETLRVREEASTEAGIVTLVSSGETYQVIENAGEWLKIQCGDKQGFVSAEFVTTEFVLGKAVSVEEEAAAKKAAEEKAAAEAKAKAEAEAKAKAKESKKETTVREATEASYDDVTLLAAVIQMEAGNESYEGKLAVGSVVINRVKSGRYPNSISAVIYQNGQFPGAGNGTLAKILSRGVKSDCIKAAEEAISGVNNVGDYMSFISKGRARYSAYGSYTVIGNHCFY